MAVETGGGAGSHVAFVATNNLDLLLAPPPTQQSTEVVNSQVMHVSLGEPDLVVREPVRVLFRHLSSSNVTRPRCVHWAEAGAWSDSKCTAEYTNATHTQCRCSTLGTLALLETVQIEDSMERVTVVVTLIVTVTVAIISAISLALLVFYCRRVKVRDDWKFRLATSGLPCFTRKREPRLHSNSSPYTGSPTFIQYSSSTLPSSDFMVLSTSAIAAHNQHDTLDPGRLQHYNPGLHQYQEHHQHQYPAQHQYHLPGHHQLVLQGRQAYTLGHQFLQQQGFSTPEPATSMEFKRRSQPGPQVPSGAFQHQQLYSVEEEGKGNHIYMEVDPLYSTHLPHSETQTELLSSPSEEEELGCSTPGLVSSNSSQSSSGYSTAPSEQYCYADKGRAGTAALFTNMKAVGQQQQQPLHQSQPAFIQRVASNQLLPSQFTKDQVFSISQLSQASEPAPVNCFDRSSKLTESKRKLRNKASAAAAVRGSQEHQLIFLEESQVI